MADYRLHPITWKNVIDYNWLQLQITITPCLVVMHLCVRGIDFVSFYNFDILFFRNVSTVFSVVLFIFNCIDIVIIMWKYLPHTNFKLLGDCTQKRTYLWLSSIL
jgi:hypothetical protein